jgi:hypothetical protein
VNPALEISFNALARTLPGTVGVAIASVDQAALSFGEWSTGVAWSTSKVPLAVAAASPNNADLIFKAIAESDNAAAEKLWSQLGKDAAELVQTVIRRAGDPATIVESRRLRAEYTPFGQTRWALAGQARFAAGLSRVPNASPVVDLLHELIDEHRWGLAAQGFAAKGGWGPGLSGDYLVRQFAIVSSTVGVAIAAEVDAGGYETGVDVVNTLTDWVVKRALPHD